jgi:hypothetical protein
VPFLTFDLCHDISPQLITDNNLHYSADFEKRDVQEESPPKSNTLFFAQLRLKLGHAHRVRLLFSCSTRPSFAAEQPAPPDRQAALFQRFPKVARSNLVMTDLPPNQGWEETQKSLP